MYTQEQYKLIKIKLSTPDLNYKDILNILKNNNVVKIVADKTSQTLEITADVQDVGSGSESLAASFSGDDLQIAFNVRYVLEGLKSIDSDRVFLRCNAPTTPAIFSPVEENVGFTYLVMPVQIRS